jgi:hypothetical protein
MAQTQRYLLSQRKGHRDKVLRNIKYKVHRDLKSSLISLSNMANI